MSLLRLGSVAFVPAIHQRMAFADEVRRTAAEFAPERIAVELPPGLREWVVRGVLRLPQISAVCYPAFAAREGADAADAPDGPAEPASSDRPTGEMFFLPIDPSDAAIEALRIGLENSLDIEFLDGGFDPARSGSADLHHYDLPDDWMIAKVGLERYVELVVAALPPTSDPRELAREEWMARRLADVARSGRRTLCVLGMAHLAGVRRRLAELLELPPEPLPPAPPIRGVVLAHLRPRSLHETLREIPHLVHLREQFRVEAEFTEEPSFDKLGHLVGALKRAQESYTDRYANDVSPTRFRAMLQFLRNLALVRGRLQPDVYHAVVAAKSCVDGDYGHEVLELLRSYEPQEKESSLPLLTVRKERGTLSDREERFRMTSHFTSPEMGWVNLGLRRRPPPERLERWKEEWADTPTWGICTWPPEDERQEKFMAHVRARAIRHLGEDQRRSVEFSTSMLDGLDVRETMRNWHTGKLFVQHAPQPKGKVGAVVLVFDDPVRDALYPWRCTLYAEHNNESDLSFYATPMGAEVVGPNICRTEFGGLLSIYPPDRIPDIWQFPGIERLDSCAEVLLAAGIMFSAERYVAYVARRPPSSFIRELASNHGRKIVFLPVQGFSENRLKTVRKLHILKGHAVRAYAADYIFDT